MPMLKSKFARCALVVIAFAVIVLLALSLVSDPAFKKQPGETRTLITRMADAVHNRYRHLQNDWHTLLHHGKARRGGKSSGKNQDSTTVVMGPANVSVTDARQRPVRDATVMVESHASHKKQQFKTDSHGTVKQKLAPGLYDLLISHAGFSSEVRMNQEILGPTVGIDLNVILAGSVSLKGKVVDEEGQPVAGSAVDGKREWLVQFHQGAAVFLDDAGYNGVVTNADGTFVLENVSLGQSVIRAAAAGYAEASTRIDVSPGATPPDLKLVLKRPASVQGQVVDEQLKPVAGVSVTALRYHPYAGADRDLTKVKFQAFTSTSGTFTLKKLFSAGTYDIQIDHAQFATMEFDNIPANTSNLTWVLQRGGEISGTVEYLDRLTTPAHVIVQATAIAGGTTVTRAAPSGADGRYQFSNLPYGVYRLSVNSNGLVSEVRPPVPSAKGKPSKNILVEVYQAGMISGHLIDAATDDPVANATVKAKVTYGYSRTRMKDFTTTSGPDGSFGFPRIPSGQCILLGQAPGYLASIPDDYSTFFLEPGGAQKDTDVYISRGGNVQGTVVDDSGQPIPDASVQLYVGSGSFTGLNVKTLHATTDGAGAFKFTKFPVGPGLQLYASASIFGYAKQSSDLINLSPMQPEAVTKITLTAGGSITGRVTDAQGHPIPDATIAYASREFPGDPSSSGFSVLGDVNGYYRIDRCTPGVAVLTATRQGYVKLARSVTVKDNVLLKNQNFKMAAGYGISGIVDDYRGKPIADARVVAYPLSGATGTSRDTTDKTGEFQIQDISLGKFRLEASFSIKTADGNQSYTIIDPEVSSNASGVAIDCDLEPQLSAKLGGTDGSSINKFTFELHSRLNTQPTQLFRFNVTRSVRGASFFRVLKIPRGLYSLKITADGYETYETDDIIVGPSERTALPTIRLKPASTIKGRLVSATTGKPIKGAKIRVLDPEKPDSTTVNRIELSNYDRQDIIEYLDSAYDQDLDLNPDPLLRLIAKVRGNVMTTVQSDFKGRFTISGIAAGEYSINIDHPDYQTRDMRNLYVARKKTSDLGDIELEPGGTITGQVLDSDGDGIYNAAVQVKGEQSGRNRAHTDRAGNFTFRGISNGRWAVTVRVSLNGRTVYRWKFVEIRSEQTSPVEIVLDTNANMTGRVVLSTGAPTSGNVRYYVVDETGTVMDDLYYSANLSHGRYTLKGIPTGHYFVVSTGKGKSGSYSMYQWVDAEAGSNSVDLEAGTGSISGVAMSVSGGGPSPAHLQFVPDVPGVVVPDAVVAQLRRNITASSTGKFSLPYLQAGVWRVWALPPGGAAYYPIDALNLSEGQRATNYRPAVPAE